MSENPLESLFQTFLNLSNRVQIHLSQFMKLPGNKKNPPSTRNEHPFPFFYLSSSSPPTAKPKQLKPGVSGNISFRPTEQLLKKEKAASPVSKQELGRATWTFLHTLAAQYPNKPTRQQKKDVKELMAILSRMYPCKECADHFKEVLRANPVQAGSQHEFSQWLCHVHNVVNRSLGKPVFSCERVDARWGKLDCEQRECDLLGEKNPWE